mmetsp:Transcript_14568/g.29912  ORF Transcript_14568/g.29912 Transcript_14568/m.29912 type:complete len:209 (-) Transcript_14568:845-1471(-)
MPHLFGLPPLHYKALPLILSTSASTLLSRGDDFHPNLIPHIFSNSAVSSAKCRSKVSLSVVDSPLKARLERLPELRRINARFRGTAIAPLRSVPPHLLVTLFVTSSKTSLNLFMSDRRSKGTTVVKIKPEEEEEFSSFGGLLPPQLFASLGNASRNTLSYLATFEAYLPFRPIPVSCPPGHVISSGGNPLRVPPPRDNASAPAYKPST